MNEFKIKCDMPLTAKQIKKELCHLLGRLYDDMEGDHVWVEKISPLPKYCTCPEPKTTYPGQDYCRRCEGLIKPKSPTIELLDDTAAKERAAKGKPSMIDNNRLKINEIINRLNKEK